MPLNYPNDSQADNAAVVQQDIEALSRRAVSIRADVSQEDEVQHLVDTTIQTYSRIDILVNNAGIASAATVENMPVSMWDQMLAVNLRSVLSVYAPGLTADV